MLNDIAKVNAHMLVQNSELYTILGLNGEFGWFVHDTS